MHASQLTVGLVVRNGEKHLEAAVGSILAQSFRSFELVIYDNASDDATPTIAQRLATADARVRVVRHARDLGVVNNLVFAAECAQTPYFCWAAHDDIREPSFLAALIESLERHPGAGLACCDVINIGPHGEQRGARPETLSLQTTTGMSSAQRLIMYLREGPGTPFYGVFRTEALQRNLGVLHRIAQRSGPPMLGVDMVFLASMFRTTDVVVVRKPLLRFRQGGVSHRLDAYGSLAALWRHFRAFARELRHATTDSSMSRIERQLIRFGRWNYLAKLMLSGPMRRMAWHYIGQDAPGASWLRALWIVSTSHPFSRLKKRARTLDRGSRIVIFGGGKHTQRCLDAIRLALGRRASIAAIIDDDPKRRGSLGGIPIHSTAEVASLRPDIVLVSSDTYEDTLAWRAIDTAPPGAAVWCIYDISLETRSEARSASSTPAMNLLSSSVQLSRSSGSERIVERHLSESMNPARI